ncbi:MAG: DUF6496 domain-containing protein [Stellaceae bacterium]
MKRVMHEFKEGELKAGRGRRGKVESRRQAIAIAMSESGQSRPRGKRKTAKKTTGKRTPRGSKSAR